MSTIGRIVGAVFMFVSALCVPHAQTVASFESFDLDPESYLNDAGGSGFPAGNILLENFYEPVFQSFEGWAISTMKDTVTPGWSNQYSAIPGAGFDGSRHYAVSTESIGFAGSVIHLTGPAAGGTVEGMYVTNSTYTYLSMRDGDAFAKRFGGESGDDPDYFLLTIHGYLRGQPGADSVLFYLADYRFDDNEMDYLVDEWTWVDLSSLGKVDSLRCKLSSSDVGAFGMNTPAYFCMDDLLTRDDGTTPVPEREQAGISVICYPNPVSEILQIDLGDTGRWDLRISDSMGRDVATKNGLTGIVQLPVHLWPAGAYILSLSLGNQEIHRRILKQ